MVAGNSKQLTRDQPVTSHAQLCSPSSLRASAAPPATWLFWEQPTTITRAFLPSAGSMLPGGAQLQGHIQLPAPRGCRARPRDRTYRQPRRDRSDEACRERPCLPRDSLPRTAARIPPAPVPHAGQSGMPAGRGCTALGCSAASFALNTSGSLESAVAQGARGVGVLGSLIPAARWGSQQLLGKPCAGQHGGRWTGREAGTGVQALRPARPLGTAPTLSASSAQGFRLLQVSRASSSSWRPENAGRLPLQSSRQEYQKLTFLEQMPAKPAQPTSEASAPAPSPAAGALQAAGTGQAPRRAADRVSTSLGAGKPPARGAEASQARQGKQPSAWPSCHPAAGQTGTARRAEGAQAAQPWDHLLPSFLHLSLLLAHL